MALLTPCFLLLLWCADIGDTCQPSGGDCLGTACFYIYRCHNSFAGATQVCTQQGLTLASVASSEERQFLWDVIDRVGSSDNLFWLGGKRESISDEFSWLDGSPFPFTSETSDLTDLCLRYRAITYNNFESNQCDQWHQYICRNGTGNTPPANTTTSATTTQMIGKVTSDSTSATPMTSVATATTTTMPVASMSTTAFTTTAHLTSVTPVTTTETTIVATINSPVTSQTSTKTVTQQITTLTHPVTSAQTTMLTTSRSQPTAQTTTTVMQPTTTTVIQPTTTTVTQPTAQTSTAAIQPTITVTQPTSVDHLTTESTRKTTIEDPASSAAETTSAANTATSDSNVTTAETVSPTLGYSPQDVSRESTSTMFGNLSTGGTTTRNTASSPGAPGTIWGTSVSDTPNSDNGIVQSSSQSPDTQGTELTITPPSTSASNASVYQSTVVTNCECCAAWREFLERNFTSGTFRLDDLLVYKRKKLQTVDDKRVSARGIGGSAVALLVVSFLTIVVLDAGKLVHDFRRMYKHLKEAFRPQNVIDTRTNRTGDA